MNPQSSTTARPATAAELHDAIRRRAEEIYFRSGCIPGRDLQNWAQAEQEIMRETAPRRSAILVKVNGIQYVGEYNPAHANGYAPGEFTPGARFEVRFKGNKMYVKRPNGSELETTIVQTA